jgi:hypothetical protein
MIINGRNYSLIMGSDLERNGMFLELYDAIEPNGDPIAECFYSDIDDALSVTTYADSISNEVLAWLRSEGARRLPPSARAV